MKNTRWLSFCLSIVLGVMVALPAVSQDSADDKDSLSIDQIRTELDSKTISLSVRETPFREVINLFRQHTSFNMVMSEKAEKMLESASTTTEETPSNDWSDPLEADSNQAPMERGEEQNEPFTRRNEKNNSFTRDGVRNQPTGTNTETSRTSVNPNVTIELNDVRLGQAMKMILDQKNMTAILKHGVVQIVPETYAESFDTRFYDVRDLLHEIKDFEAPKMDFERGAGINNGNKSTKEDVPQTIFEPQDNREKKNILSNREDFIELVRSNVGNGGWNRGGNIQIHSGVMVVHQAPDVHKEISHLLKRLRQFR